MESGASPAYNGALPVIDGAAKVTGAVVLVVISVLPALVVSAGPANTPAQTAAAPIAALPPMMPIAHFLVMPDVFRSTHGLPPVYVGPLRYPAHLFARLVIHFESTAPL